MALTKIERDTLTFQGSSISAQLRATSEGPVYAAISILEGADADIDDTVMVAGEDLEKLTELLGVAQRLQ